MLLALRGRLYLSEVVSEFEHNLTHWLISTQVSTISFKTLPLPPQPWSWMI